MADLEDERFYTNTTPNPPERLVTNSTPDPTWYEYESKQNEGGMMRRFIEDLKEYREEYFGLWVNLFTGYFFEEFFGWVREKSEEEDWNGLIKFILYPLVSILSVVVSIGAIPVYVALPFLLLAMILIILCLGGLPYLIGTGIWKGIVWLDKKLRFKRR